MTLADLCGTVWLANFIYTECTETCPLQSLQVQSLQEEFAGARALRLVSITVDPGHDTPAVLRRYAERYEADPERWLFLTGPKPAIHALATDGFKLGVSDAIPAARSGLPGWLLGPRAAFASHGSGGLILHSSRLVPVDRQARIRAFATISPGRRLIASGGKGEGNGRLLGWVRLDGGRDAVQCPPGAWAACAGGGRRDGRRHLAGEGGRGVASRPLGERTGHAAPARLALT